MLEVLALIGGVTVLAGAGWLLERWWKACGESYRRAATSLLRGLAMVVFMGGFLFAFAALAIKEVEWIEHGVPGWLAFSLTLGIFLGATYAGVWFVRGIEALSRRARPGSAEPAPADAPPPR